MLRKSRFRRAVVPAVAFLFGASCGGDRVAAPARSLSLVAAPSLQSMMATECPAGATRWIAAVSGSWFDAARWSAGVPTAAVPACIDLPGAYIITATNITTVAAQSLFLGDPDAATQPILRIGRGTLVVTGDATVHGRVELAPPSSLTAGLRAGGVLGVGPTGTITTANPGSKIAEGTTIANEGTIIVGSAFPSVSHMNLRAATLVNRGTITVPTGRQLLLHGPATGGSPTVTFEAGTIDASGLFEQTNGSLTLRGGNVTGTVKLIAASELRLEHDGGGRFDLWRGPGIVNPTTPRFLTRLVGEIGSDQHVWIGNNHIAVESHSIVNRGRITLASTAAIGTLAAVLRTATGHNLINAADGTITLTGTGSPVLAGFVVNEGLIEATDDAVLQTSVLFNRGVFRTSAGARVNAVPLAPDQPTNFITEGGRLDMVTGGYSQTGGNFESLGGTVSATGLLTLNAVRFKAFGAWARALTLVGASRMAPGGSIGRLSITGDYSPSAATVTEIQLAGGEAGVRYDQIAVSATARFAGSLSVALAGGFVPRPCQTFDVVTYAARTNMFANAATPIDVGGGVKLRQVYTPTKLVLVAYSANGPNVSPTEVEVSVDGTTATYDVCIGAGADVIAVIPDDQVTVDKTTLTFGASQLPQTVTVAAASGASKSEALIRHTASSGTAVGSVKVLIAGAVPADVDPPTTTASATPAANEHGWNRENVTIALNASDAGSGVREIVWSLAGAQIGGATVTGSSASVVVSAEGETQLSYFARDVAGNQESPKSLTIRIDKTSPTVTVTREPPPNANGWNNTPVTATFVASDELSGIDGSSTAQVEFTEDGANQSASRTFRDRAGNEATGTITGVSIDRVPPTIACSATPNALWPPNGQLIDIAIRVTTDGASSFLLERVSSNEPEAGDILDFAAGTPDTQGRVRAARLGSGAGRIYTFVYRAFDLAGNSAPASCEVGVAHDQGKRKP